MTNNENIKDVTVDCILEMISKLHFERFKARMQGDELKARAFDEEMNRLSRLLEESVKEK